MVQNKAKEMMVLDIESELNIHGRDWELRVHYKEVKLGCCCKVLELRMHTQGHG